VQENQKSRKKNTPSLDTPPKREYRIALAKLILNGTIVTTLRVENELKFLCSGINADPEKLLNEAKDIAKAVSEKYNSLKNDSEIDQAIRKEEKTFFVNQGQDEFANQIVEEIDEKRLKKEDLPSQANTRNAEPNPTPPVNEGQKNDDKKSFSFWGFCVKRLQKYQ